MTGPRPTTLRLAAIAALAAAVLWSLPLIGCGPEPSDEPTVTVFAAASTARVLTQLGAVFEAESGRRVRFSFDSSSSLARQIRAGAPADLFISADQAWMDDLAAAQGGAGVLRDGTRVDLVANRLVLVVPTASTVALEARPGFDIAAAAGSSITRLAMGDPEHVPAGRYGRQALEWLGWWGLFEPRVIAASDVRAALRLVEIGEADAAIVYATDARQSPEVRVAGVFPAESHRPIVYPAALTARASPAAAEFLEFLRSPRSRELFEREGFTVVSDAGGPR